MFQIPNTLEAFVVSSYCGSWQFGNAKHACSEHFSQVDKLQSGLTWPYIIVVDVQMSFHCIQLFGENLQHVNSPQPDSTHDINFVFAFLD
jgi:hypothetical protein